MSNDAAALVPFGRVVGDFFSMYRHYRRCWYSVGGAAWMALKAVVTELRSAR
jgi:hypothetical protein